ncbi:sugar kinase, ribokinase [Saccharomonospora marina XMU15]|uniref:Ribokinase n=1 Tax=Saccharomonospora marina XMU15 TaxID=882083 RepID=H5WX19_9PSEU|nr:sugar kinase, ribokinase [Saccharomonospora marina XMU15]
MLVVGSANVDLVVEAERRPAGGETVLGADTVVLPGGKGANTAVAAARLGADVALVGAVGDDGFGRLLLESLRASGTRTDHVRTVDRPTGVAYITVTPDGENSILVSPGANRALCPEAVTAALPGASVLVASLEVPVPTVEHALAAAEEAGVRTVLNLSPVAEIAERALNGLDVLLVNQHEAAWLLGAESVEATRLLELGPKAAVVTKGPSGAVVVTGAGSSEIPAPEVDAVDTTGAGDAFAGAFATALARGASIADAATSAVRVATMSVLRRGAQPSYPTAAELE